MTEAFIPVDLFNPGQVFACLGFLEAADVLLGDAEGGFDWTDEANVRFALRAAGNENPFAVVLAFLATANVLSLAPPGSDYDSGKWSVPTEVIVTDAPFPFPAPSSPGTLPAAIEGVLAKGGGATARLVIDHWGDATRRDAVKFWGGSGGYSGAARARDAIKLVRDHCGDVALDPFAFAAEQGSSFRFDWRRDYIPIDTGFSLNSHSGRIVTVGFPLVEIFAALGLGNARPRRLRKLEYQYGVIGTRRGATRMSSGDSFFEPTLLRAALGGSELPFPRRSFRMQLGWPAQEDQERSITGVIEEMIR